MVVHETSLRANANEEWPEIIKIGQCRSQIFPSSSVRQALSAISNEGWPGITKIGESRTVKMRTQTIEPKKVSLKSMSVKDLKSIKKNDSFLYYSIPGVRSAKMLMKDIDASKGLTKVLSTCELKRNSCNSSSLRLQTLPQGNDLTVKRSSCISFECHPDVFFQDFILDDEECADEIFGYFDTNP
ncbi:hypothetical protein ACHAXR_002554 [Thalassiosira sp. AJA248-18]